MDGLTEISRPSDASLNKYSLEYSHEDLSQATRNFDPQLLLGSGTIGSVFRGIQRDGCEVAIKAFDIPENSGFEEEVRVLSRFRHPNLVILMGFARCGPKRFLVYELMCGGDVHMRLRKSCTENVPFSWRQRVSAAFDAACGLSHLHNSTPKAFHRDIKTSNILLDRNGTAKMADFGLACLSDTSARKVGVAAGTLGYACPHYVQRAIVTTASEVYSFGIVILEIFTALPPVTVARMTDGSEIYTFLVSAINGDTRAAMTMGDVKADWPLFVSQVLAVLGLRCTDAVEAIRPDMTGIVSELRPLRDAPDTHSPPEQKAVETLPVGQVVTRIVRRIITTPPPPAQVAEEPAMLAQTLPQEPSCRPSSPQQGADLWVLECVSSSALGLVNDLTCEQRSLVHREKPERPISAMQRVGRLFQSDFFSLVANDEGDVCRAVSREHFQIWAEEVSSVSSSTALPSEGIPCLFFLTNYSANGTIVNDVHIHARGDQVALHHGDKIVIPACNTTDDDKKPLPLLEFRYKLSASVLFDADLVPTLAESAPSPGTILLGGSPPISQNDEEGAKWLFFLEASGPAVRDDVPVELRRIFQSAHTPLRLGRTLQREFWQNLLHEEGLGMMSREHLQIDVCFEGSEAKPLFFVKNLSGTGSILLRSAVGNTATMTVERYERQPLSHGDTIVLVPSKKLGLSLKFLDLTVEAWEAAVLAKGGA